MRRGLLLVLLLAAAQARAEFSDGGQPESWTKLGTGARQLAMGRAATAMEGDAYSLGYNPAGLVSLARVSLGSQTALLSQDRRLDYLSLAKPLDLPNWHPGGGVSVSRFSLESPVERRDTNTPEPIGQWYDTSYEFRLGVGSWLGDGPSSHAAVGASVRIYLDHIGDASGEGMALDLGSLYRLRSWITLAWSIQNVLAQHGWSDGSSDPSPIGFLGGAAARFYERRILLSLELEKNQAQDTRYRGGLEFWAVKERLALRAGWDADRPSAGLGFAMEYAGTGLGLDYAIRSDPAQSGALDHRISLSLDFDTEDPGAGR